MYIPGLAFLIQYAGIYRSKQSRRNLWTNFLHRNTITKRLYGATRIYSMKHFSTSRKEITIYEEIKWEMNFRRGSVDTSKYKIRFKKIDNSIAVVTVSTLNLFHFTSLCASGCFYIFYYMETDKIAKQVEKLECSSWPARVRSIFLPFLPMIICFDRSYVTCMYVYVFLLLLDFI